jgi:hypothetical protein
MGAPDQIIDAQVIEDNGPEQTANEIAYLAILMNHFNTLAAFGDPADLRRIREELMRRIEISLDLGS